jgi:uncharacterized protein YndB with AHSA1/START domain
MAPMNDPVIVTREIDVDVEAGALWPLVADGAGWAQWLAPEVDVDVAEGGTGTVVDDDGVERTVRVDSVVPGDSVRFTWWPTEGFDDASIVELVILPGKGGSRLRITEIQAAAPAGSRAGGTTGALATCASSWEWRLVALWLAVAAFARV